jgi:hypothetical protein
MAPSGAVDSTEHRRQSVAEVAIEYEYEYRDAEYEYETNPKT